MHDTFLILFSLLSGPAHELGNIFSEPITQILGVPEGDVAGEIFINMGSTINITCIVHGNLPEKSSMFWTHNNEVSYICFVLWVERDATRKVKLFCNKAKVEHCRWFIKVRWWLEFMFGTWRNGESFTPQNFACGLSYVFTKAITVYLDLKETHPLSNESNNSVPVWCKIFKLVLNFTKSLYNFTVWNE